MAEFSGNTQETGFESWEGIPRRAEFWHPNLSVGHPAFQGQLSLQAVQEFCWEGWSTRFV